MLDVFTDVTPLAVNMASAASTLKVDLSKLLGATDGAVDDFSASLSIQSSCGVVQLQLQPVTEAESLLFFFSETPSCILRDSLLVTAQQNGGQSKAASCSPVPEQHLSAAESSTTPHHPLNASKTDGSSDSPSEKSLQQPAQVESQEEGGYSSFAKPFGANSERRPPKVTAAACSFQSASSSSKFVAKQNHFYEHLIGQRIRITWNQRPEQSVCGNLLGVQGTNAILSAEDGSMQCFSLQESCLTALTPSTSILAARIDKFSPEEQSVNILFRIAGISCRAQYSVILSNSHAALTGKWLIMNSSDCPLNNVATQIAIDDELSVESNASAGHAKLHDMSSGRVGRTFHWRIPGRLSMKKDELLHIPFLSEIFEYTTGILVKRTNARFMGMLDMNKDSRNVKPTAFHPEILEIPPRQSAMGSLPPGKCSVYIERDDESQTTNSHCTYVAETSLSVTRAHDFLTVALGTVFGISSHVEQAKFSVHGKNLLESFRITLSNRHPVQVTVLFEDCCFRWNEWKVIRSSHQWYKSSKDCARFRLTVDPCATVFLQYTIEYDLPEYFTAEFANPISYTKENLKPRSASHAADIEPSREQWAAGNDQAFLPESSKLARASLLTKLMTGRT